MMSMRCQCEQPGWVVSGGMMGVNLEWTISKDKRGRELETGCQSGAERWDCGKEGGVFKRKNCVEDMKNKNA